jgi:prepilin-type N-terminal cleavage/methylation domain-containing protein
MREKTISAGLYLKAFTLAELLIAIAILGILAAFAIPKILEAQSNAKYSAIIREDAAAIAGAYQVLIKQHGGNPSTITREDIAQFLNYTALLNSGETIDRPYWPEVPYTGMGETCDVSSPCLKMHNGSLMKLYGYSTQTFCDASDNSSILEFYVDPDGEASSIAAIGIHLHPNGRITSRGTVNGSVQMNGCSNYTGEPDRFNDNMDFTW